MTSTPTGDPHTSTAGSAGAGQHDNSVWLDPESRGRAAALPDVLPVFAAHVDAVVPRPIGPGDDVDDDVDIAVLRTHIDNLDSQIVGLIGERTATSRLIQERRIRGGGNRVSTSRELEIIRRYDAALGDVGNELAALLLRHARSTLTRNTKKEF